MGQPNAATTFLGEDVKIVWVRKSTGETIMPDEADRLKLGDAKAGTGEGHCRFCKSNDHWSTRCPYKDQMEVNENDELEDEATAAAGAAGAGNVDKTGKYIPPSARGGTATGLTDLRRSDENTLRITNLPSHTDENDFRQLVIKAITDTKAPGGSYPGKISRLFMARDKVTGSCKGFAYVTFERNSDAERARVVLDNHKFEYSVLKVDWSESKKV